ncbi:hypothetical protein ACJIZ3_019057 [Penstemon smallii]|uniref:ATP synthase F0 subunit 8 n=1 Tax=Penstemon smallii TaxID=265156 RepID=A0ABD3T052_9LAMI
MEESFSLSYWDYFVFILLRPILAILFTLSSIFIGWFLAWKLVLVHVPLVQEIFGLKKKPVNKKPAGGRRLTHFYNRLNAQNPSSEWILLYAFDELLNGMLLQDIKVTANDGFGLNLRSRIDDQKSVRRR